MVDGGDVATVTGLAAELRRGVAHCGGLPSFISGHGRRQWVDGELVEQLRWLDGEVEQAGDRPTTAANCSAAVERTQAKEELRK